EDEDGYFWVVGRSDDAINVSGHRLSTMEMENAILESKSVSEVAVIGVADAIKGEVPVVFATLTKEAGPEDRLRKQIKQSVTDGIGQFARPQSVFFVEAMPKTVSGKIMRRLLKEIVTEGGVAGDV